MKNVTCLTTSQNDLIENFFAARTLTRGRVNTTAVNNLCIALAANGLNNRKIKAGDFTVSITKMAEFLVDRLNVTTAYHKKDSVAIHKRIASATQNEILSSPALTADCKKISAYRLRNHCLDHHRKLKDMTGVIRKVDPETMTITLTKKFVIAIKTDRVIRKHVAELTKEIKTATNA